MQLYLVRHGRALEVDINPLCPLSEEGITQIETLGVLLQQQQVSIDKIYHSEQLRAVQSAAILAKALNHKKNMIQTKDLDPSASIDKMVNIFQMANENILCVSHEPFIQRVVSYLLTQRDYYPLLKLHPASIVCLEKQASEQWLIKMVA